MAEVTLFSGEPITRGDAVQLNLTLNTDGAATDVTGDTLTASFYFKGREVLSDKAVTLVTPASGIVRISLTGANTLTFPEGEITFDVKAATLVRHWGPGRFMVRRGLT